MKRIQSVIEGLQRIDGGIADAGSLPPDVVDRGDHPTIKIWEPEIPESVARDGVHDEPTHKIDAENIVEISPQVDWPWIEDVVGTKSGKLIERNASVIGTDAYAWYVSFRYHESVQWGIYFSKAGLKAYAQSVFKPYSISAENAVKLSVKALMHHEEYHFRIDYAIAQAELVNGQACYLSAVSRMSKEYGYIPDEEALANAASLIAFHSLPRALQKGGPSPLLREFIKRQPEGYRDGGKYTSRKSEAFQIRTSRLIRDYLQDSPVRGPRLEGIDGYGLLPHRDKWQNPWQYCPLIYVDDLAGNTPSSAPPNAIFFIPQIPEIQETRKFAKELRRLPDPIKRKWEKAKEKLCRSTQSGNLKFKKWPEDATPRFPNVYSVNIDRGYRAHIGRDGDTREWWGIKIGSHTSMGHG